MSMSGGESNKGDDGRQGQHLPGKKRAKGSTCIGRHHARHQDGTLRQPWYIRDEEDDGGQLLSRKKRLEHGLHVITPDHTTYLAFAAFRSMLSLGNGRREGR
jgi:hypothetical protein